MRFPGCYRQALQDKGVCCPGGSCPGGSCPGGFWFGGILTGGILAGGILSRGDFGWGDSVRGDFGWGDIVQGDFVRGDFVLEPFYCSENIKIIQIHSILSQSGCKVVTHSTIKNLNVLAIDEILLIIMTRYSSADTIRHECS